MNRRHFVMGSALAAGTSLATKARAGANDRVRVACVGVRGQGGSHIAAYNRMENVEIAAVCAVDEGVINKRLGEIEKAKGSPPPGYSDLRRLLADEESDT